MQMQGGEAELFLGTVGYSFHGKCECESSTWAWNGSIES
jgi:hypothetical protein